jgi:general nucleoside transport system ATP-binding protein
LMNILYGLIQRDAGEVLLRGHAVHFRSAHDAIAHGLGMVHQHFMLVPTFTVVENMVLGQPSSRAPFLEDRRRVARRISQLSEQYGLRVDPHAQVWQLSVGQEQRVEILKALYRGAEILVLDEPTAVLTPEEVDGLLATLRNLARQGKSIIFISHKLAEVIAVSDRIAVLRDGRLVSTVWPQETSAAELGRLMVGRDVALRVRKTRATPGEVLLSVRDLWANDDRDLAALRGVSLDVRAGEIVGIAGVEGNGQRELEEVIAGLRPPQQGQVVVRGQDVTHATPRAIFDAGLGHVPADRYRTALLGDFSVADNLVLRSIERQPFTRMGLLRRAAIRASAAALVRRFDIRAPSVAAAVTKLSGGNAQKVVVARELSRQPKVLLAAQPTRGIDVGAIEFIHRELLRQRDLGTAILLISTDLEEILSLSDRVLVLYEGRVMGERLIEAVDVQELGLMMAGAKASQTAGGQ